MRRSVPARALYIILALLVSMPNLPIYGAAGSTEQKIDLDGNPLNGAESKVSTRVLSTYPVQVENTVFNNAGGRSWRFDWPGAGPAGFASSLTVGPGVGAQWVWTSTSVIYSIESPITFTPSLSVPVFGQHPGGVFPVEDSSPRVFMVPGKSIFPTQVTLSNASLTSSLITFFSPPTTRATCGVECVSGQCDLFVENTSGETATIKGEQPGCCLEPQQIICGGECYSYLEDPQNCGGCGIACGAGEVCSNGECMCPEEGQTQCGDGCFDLAADTANCGTCDTVCLAAQSCEEGACLCPAGESVCGEACANLATDTANCGECSNACQPEESCAAGVCTCPEGETQCSGACVDLYSDRENCGACGFECGEDLNCDNYTCFCPLEGQTDCSGTCTYTSVDHDNCGACGVACGEDQFCYESQCFCTGEGLTNCGGACVDLQADLDNCGTCGNECGDYDLCTGGECSPYPDDASASAAVRAAETMPVAAVSGMTRLPKVVATTAGGSREASASRGVAPSRKEGAVGGGRRAEPEASRKRQPEEKTAGPDPSVAPAATNVPGATTAAPLVEEAPICDLAPFEQIVPDGGRFELSMTGGRYGKEIQTTVTLENSDGEMIAQGPCPMIVPVVGANTTGVILSPVRVATIDSSGDAICQPSEGHCDYFLSLDNVGDTACLNPVATLASAPDEFNGNEVEFLNDTSTYPSWAAYPGSGAPPERRTNLMAFSIATPEEQASNAGRHFELTVDCANTEENIVVPMVLGIGGSCNPGIDLNGQSYDMLDGFRSPLNSPLILEGGPVDSTMPRIKRGNAIPLKIRFGCGGLFLDDTQINPNPEVISVVHQTLGPQPLQLINYDGANPFHPLFNCDAPEVDSVLGIPVPQCQYNLRTKKLPLGNYVISVRMPDSRVFQAGFAIKP